MGSVSRRGIFHVRQDAPLGSTTAESTPAIQTHNRSNVPKINGSEGAFIGLVVALSLIFILACAAIFLLLRYHEPTSHERERRRKYSIRRPGASHPLPIGLHDPESSEGFGSVKEKLGNMFKSGRRTRSGWLQAAGDEWDSGDESALTGERREMVSVNAAQAGRTAEFIHPAGVGKGDDGLAASPLEMPYEDPFSETPVIHVQAPSGPAPSAFEPYDGRATSYFPTRKTPGREERGPSSDSVQQVSTLAGGTKFRENV
ncbi:hypothetical protein HETIRDRAFT_146087 [Heterobasidion irregulare TC 32-1]|uniref:Uncharacterized protein n=1 Tax=Heterobasidion irregulare (strain TC 32-1) TaxID=747525 RepID=W4KIK2_HETIT|nr:uncharacterized protein HETIRDRAFT_146087 [Heterobasidion irregulare TC 32-1]ETW85150.1 hypothetical protein HETIRDRAFT_146087 [Heterobasidion irregulare TC 32-1]